MIIDTEFRQKLQLGFSFLLCVSTKWSIWKWNWQILCYVLIVGVRAEKNFHLLTSRSLQIAARLRLALFHGSGYAQIFAKDSKNEQWYAPFSRLKSSEGSVKEERIRAVSSRNCCTNWPLASLVTSAIYQHRLSRLECSFNLSLLSLNIGNEKTIWNS